MTSGRGLAISMSILVMLVMCAGISRAQRIDIYSGLAAGTIWANFRGDGDTAIIATVGREPGGPTEVVIPTGAVYHLAALYGPSMQQYGGGGAGLNQRQGMYQMSSTTINLAMTPQATVILPAVCMDYGKPEPTPWDRMAIAPPNGWQAKLAAAVDSTHPSQPVLQLAMWAAANNVSLAVAARYSRTLARSGQRGFPAGMLLSGARTLLRAAGLDTSAMLMFRGTG